MITAILHIASFGATMKQKKLMSVFTYTPMAKQQSGQINFNSFSTETYDEYLSELRHLNRT